MVLSNNYTIFGIQDNAERYFWAAYNFFVVLSSFIGDSLILYASFQRDAFKIHKFVVTVMQYIAVFDLASASTTSLPGGITLFANTWILGDAMCNALAYLASYFYSVGICLIAVMTSGKFLQIKYPLRSTALTKRMAHKICISIVITYLVAQFICLMVDKDDIELDYRVYSCQYMYTHDIWKTLLPIMITIMMLIPNIVIVATTVPILVIARRYARRFGESIHWQGALPLALTAVVYCISTLPLFVYFIGSKFVLDSKFKIEYYRISAYLATINIMSNFYIYALTINSFRGFLLFKIVSFTNLFRNMTTSTGEIIIELLGWL